MTSRTCGPRCHSTAVESQGETWNRCTTRRSSCSDGSGQARTFLDTSMTWVAYIANDHVWSVDTGNWCGTVHDTTHLDRSGRVVVWSPEKAPSGNAGPDRPARPARSPRSARPARPPCDQLTRLVPQAAGRLQLSMPGVTGRLQQNARLPIRRSPFHPLLEDRLSALAADRMTWPSFSCDGEFEREREAGYLFDAALR